MNVALFLARRISSNSTSGYSGKLIKLAIATTSLCIATMVLSSTVIKGFKKEISHKIFGFWGHVHLTDLHVTRNFELRPIKYDKTMVDSLMAIGSLEYLSEAGTNETTIGGVSSVSPYINYPGVMQRKDQIDAIVLKGLDSGYDINRFSEYIKEGAFPNLSDTIASREILISEQTSKRLFLNIGDKVVLNFIVDKDPIKRRFKVSGIYRTGLEEYDVKFAFVDLRALQAILGWESDMIAGYEVFLDDFHDAKVVADYVYQEVLPPNMYAATIQEKQRSIFEWLELQDINERVIFLMMALVALINMATALLILILERSRMIGVLKSLGQDSWSLRRVFIYSAIIIVLSSLLIGNFIGLGIAFLQKFIGFLKLDETNYYLSEVPIHFDIFSLLMINLFVVVVTAVMMVLPTYLVTRIKPIDMLRFE